MKRDPFHCLPRTEAGCLMPSANTIEIGDRNRRIEAEIGSAALLRALQRYFARGGRG